MTILPVDSEHSALFQLVAAAGRGRGGLAGHHRLGRAVPRPDTSANWPGSPGSRPWLIPPGRMGEKITIDSATLMNKGLEVIEAHHLFGLPYERIEVVVHPQSLVHALVRMVDGALLAHLGSPDMRVPIAYRAALPAAGPGGGATLDLAAGMSLEFAAPDESTFPAIRLAREAGHSRGTLPPAPSTRPTKWRCGRSWMGACLSWVYQRWWKAVIDESEAGVFRNVRRGGRPSTMGAGSWQRRLVRKLGTEVRCGD